MSDPTQSPNSNDPDVEGQDGEVRDVDDPAVQEDTVSGGAPEEPDDTEGSSSE